ncbi:MAG: AMP-binding protein [Gammaproteobacteria bacterium]|nr:AMP-binding protein [Gammaproteobacteria bacterium]
MSQSEVNLYSSFQKQFLRHAEKPALFTGNGESISFQDLETRSARLASYLTQSGVIPGDRVTVQVQKSPEAVCLYLACLRAGFVFHPLNTGYKPAELEYYIGDARPAAIICDAGSGDVMQQLAGKAGVTKVLTLNADGSGSLPDAASEASENFETVTRDKDDMAALLYSSGTTGVPKGIMLSHENLLVNAQSLIEFWGFTENDVLLHALPIFHVHGLFVGLGCAFLSGASMRWAPAFDAKQAVELLPECTVMMGVPTYYTRLLGEAAFDKNVVSNMRLFISGSAPLLEETFNEFEQHSGHRILERYGMTETNMNTSNPLVGERKAGTVGKPLPGVEVRIVDDQGKSLVEGEIGNLQVRGNNVFKAYWNMPEKTAEDFTEDNFFNTGDKGRIDSDSYVSIVGRAKDMIISGGLNVYPKEIELLIDNVTGVKESAVIGLAHSDFGEAVVAVLVASGVECPEETELIARLKEQLAGFKVPKRVLVIDELPRNTMGKVQKNVLREQYKDLFSGT